MSRWFGSSTSSRYIVDEATNGEATGVRLAYAPTRAAAVDAAIVQLHARINELYREQTRLRRIDRKRA